MPVQRFELNFLPSHRPVKAARTVWDPMPPNTPMSCKKTPTIPIYTCWTIPGYLVLNTQHSCNYACPEIWLVIFYRVTVRSRLPARFGIQCHLILPSQIKNTCWTIPVNLIPTTVHSCNYAWPDIWVVFFFTLTARSRLPARLWIGCHLNGWPEI